MILGAAQARGELREGADPALAAHMLVGAYYAQYLAGTPFGEDWSVDVVAAVLAGLLHT